MKPANIKNTSSDLFKYFQFIRLKKDKEICERNVEANKQNISTNLTFKEKISNTFKSINSSIHKYNENLSKANANYNYFLSKHLFYNSNQIPSVNSIFISDNIELEKIIFAISIILDDEYKYIYRSDGLKAVSEKLFGNSFRLEKIEESLEEHYKYINHKPLSNIQKGILIGISVASLLTIVACPLLVGGANASAAVTTSALAAYGFGDMQIGIGMLALNSIMFSSITTGLTYLTMDKHNIQLAKKEFRSLTCDQESMYLSIQCLCIEHIKSKSTASDFKKNLDETLKNMDVLRSDITYLLFIENEDTKNNKEKLASFNRFEQRLLKILNI